MVIYPIAKGSVVHNDQQNIPPNPQNKKYSNTSFEEILNEVLESND